MDFCKSEFDVMVAESIPLGVYGRIVNLEEQYKICHCSEDF